MNDSFDVTTVVFAILAIFVLWKLRSVLGARTGNEKPPGEGFWARRSAPPPDAAGNVVRLPGAAQEPPPGRQPGRAPGQAGAAWDRWKGIAEPGSRVAEGLDAICAADPSFAPKPFVDGAKAAYEIIVTAYAKGDLPTLQSLLAGDVYDSFAAGVNGRQARGEKAETTIVSIDAVTLEDAQLRGKLAQITVRFATKLINATHDAAGALVDGNPEKIVDLSDVWTFAREAGARDPNWKLVATESGH